MVIVFRTSLPVVALLAEALKICEVKEKFLVAVVVADVVSNGGDVVAALVERVSTKWVATEAGRLESSLWIPPSRSPVQMAIGVVRRRKCLRDGFWGGGNNASGSVSATRKTKITVATGSRWSYRHVQIVSASRSSRRNSVSISSSS